MHAMPDAGHSGRDWRSLVRVSFLEVQRHKWERALAAGGVLPASGQAASQGLLPSYLRAGMAAARQAAPTDQEAAWKQVPICGPSLESLTCSRTLKEGDDLLMLVHKLCPSKRGMTHMLRHAGAVGSIPVPLNDASA